MPNYTVHYIRVLRYEGTINVQAENQGAAMVAALKNLPNSEESWTDATDLGALVTHAEIATLVDPVTCPRCEGDGEEQEVIDLGSPVSCSLCLGRGEVEAEEAREYEEENNDG